MMYVADIDICFTMFETSTNQLNLTGTFHVKDATIAITPSANYDDIVVAKNTTAGVSIISSDGTSAALNLGSPTDAEGSQYAYVPSSNYSQIGHARAGGYVKLTSGNSAEALRLDANQNVTASNDLTASGNVSGSSFYGGTFYGSAAGLTNTTIPSNASDNHVLIASSGFITTNPANAVLKSDRFDIGSSGFISAMTGALHVSGAGMVGNDSLLTVCGRDAGQIFEVTGSGGAVVTGFLSASTSISASEYYIQTGNSIYFGDGDGTKITRNGTKLDINGDHIIFNAATQVSASSNLSASAYYWGPDGQNVISSSPTDASILATKTGMFVSADGGNLTLQNNVVLDGNSFRVSAAGAVSASANISGSSFYTAGDIVLGSDQKVWLNSSGYDFQISGTAGGVGYYFDQTKQNIGIGTEQPETKLHVSSSGDKGLFCVSGHSSGSILFVTGNLDGGGGALGVGTTEPHYRIDTGDDTSTVRFGQFSAGAWPGSPTYMYVGHENLNHSALTEYAIAQSAGGETNVNSTGDLYFRVNHAIKAAVDSTGNFGIGQDAGHSSTWEPSSLLHVSGSDDEGLLTIDAPRGVSPVLTVTGAQGVGINTNLPHVPLDVHYSGNLNPTNLGNNKGGGEVVYFGTSTGMLSQGALYYLDSSGVWKSANASLTGSGHDQLLGISLGEKAVDNGMLIRGFYNVATYYSAAFGLGSSVYIQSSSVARSATEGGFMSASGPTAGNSFVRVVGYGTDTANVIYFNPSSTYVEVSEH